MARTRTLLQLRDEVRQRADMVNSDFVSDAEINRYLNESISELYDMLIAVQGQEWYVKTHDFTMAAGADTYDIHPDHDFYLLLGVDVNAGGPTPIPLQPYMLDERHNRSRDFPVYSGIYRGVARLRYRMGGTIDELTGVYQHQITIKPTSSASGRDYTLIYIPHAPVLNNDVDVWDGFNGWEEYAIVDSTIKCLEKEESSTLAQERRKERLIGRIEGLASAHDDGFPERVTDVTRRWPFYYNYYG